MDHFNCRLIGNVAVLCGFVLGAFTTPAGAQTTIVSVSGPQAGSGGLGIFPTQSVAFSFTVSQAYSDVTISANLIGSFGGTAYLMNRVGPGTTVADEIASGPFVSSVPSGGWSRLQPVLQNVSLADSGTYIVVLSTTQVNPPQGIVITGAPTIVADVGASNGPFFVQVARSTSGGYAPAAPFYQNPSGFVGEFQVTGTPSSLSVSIDIKPGSFPNSINLGSRGTLPVAIFSTSGFDATSVDPSTVTLAGAAVKVKGNGTPQASSEDVNGDGLLDFVVHVETEALQLSDTDTEAVLEGYTSGGQPITGTDTVRVVP